MGRPRDPPHLVGGPQQLRLTTVATPVQPGVAFARLSRSGRVGRMSLPARSSACAVNRPAGQRARAGTPGCRRATEGSFWRGATAIYPASRTQIAAVHARHAAHKATTQRDGRAASLRCTGRRRDRGPVQIVFLRLALLARVTFRAHLAQPQLSQHLVDLPGEFAWQVGVACSCATAVTSSATRRLAGPASPGRHEAG